MEDLSAVTRQTRGIWDLLVASDEIFDCAGLVISMFFSEAMKWKHFVDKRKRRGVIWLKAHLSEALTPDTLPAQQKANNCLLSTVF